MDEEMSALPQNQT